MQIDFQSEKPIYIQLADVIKDAIISGSFAEGTQIPSTTEISTSFKVNPATALKGINILVDEGLVYKKRGVGMFVSENAVDMLKSSRKSEFINSYISSLINEAKKLNITKEQIIAMIEKGF